MFSRKRSRQTPGFSARLFRLLLWKCPFLRRKNSVYGSFFAGEKTFSRRAPRLSLLLHSPRRSPGSPKTTPAATWLTPDLHRAHGRPPVQEYRLRLKQPTPDAARRCPSTFKILDPRKSFGALAPAALFAGRFASLRFRPKNMVHHDF
jgi:hypothetical protein